MIKPEQFDLATLVKDLFGGDYLTPHWLKHITIIPDYMPPYPREDTRPTCQIRYQVEGSDDHDAQWLRYFEGPIQGYFWDIYGSDFVRPELALLALTKAPPPPATFGRKFYQEFKVPLRTKPVESE